MADEHTIGGRPPRLPHKDPSVAEVRLGWLKLGGKEWLQWKSGYLTLYWEVWTEQDHRGYSFPKSGFVVEWSHFGGSGSQRFPRADGVAGEDLALVQADDLFEKHERDNLVEIAASALGVL